MPHLLISLIGALLIVAPAWAVAPTRSGQAYAESICNTDPNILFCEDYNFPANFSCVGLNFTWINPGSSVSGATLAEFCSAADFPAASGFLAQPAGSPAGGNVYRANLGTGCSDSNTVMCLLGDCNRNTADTPTTYQNGSTATNDLYIRFQVYHPTGYPWPTTLDNKMLFLYPNQFTSRPDANIDSGIYNHILTHCNSPLNNFGDAMAFREGPGGLFRSYPAANNGDVPPLHFEYCDGTGAPNGLFGDSTVPAQRTSPVVGNPDPGTLFRYAVNRWYTIEFRYKLGTAGGFDGTIEAWVDGVKVYGDSGLLTCGDNPTQGNCYAVHEVQILNSWFNPGQPDCTAAVASGSYRLMDNLIVSRAPIGVPSVGGEDTTAPAAPANLRVVNP